MKKFVTFPVFDFIGWLFICAFFLFMARCDSEVHGQPPAPVEVVEVDEIQPHDEPLVDDVINGIVLKAPDTCQVGELVRFDATSSDVDSLTWDIVPPTPDFEVVDLGERAIFSARNSGEWLVILAGAKGGQSFLSHKKIVVGSKLPITWGDKPAGKFKQLTDRLEREQ